MSAVFSEDRQYRYSLSREWLIGDGTLLFLMLNPSTADAIANDPTVTRCIGFAHTWGFQRLLVGNIFALRSTDPAALLTHDDPIGPENDEWLARLVGEADQVVVAWGAHAAVIDREPVVCELLNAAGADVTCLRKTAGGHPGHPLYIPAAQAPEPWDPAVRRTHAIRDHLAA